MAARDSAGRPGRLMEWWPLLLVDDLSRSVARYGSKLGFELVAEATTDGHRYWCRMSRDTVSVMLQQRHEDDPPTAPVSDAITLYVLCDSAKVLYVELLAAGLDCSPPVEAPYGMVQLFLRDPDGYPLCFESFVPEAP